VPSIRTKKEHSLGPVEDQEATPVLKSSADVRAGVLFEAEHLVNGDRNNQYGDPIEDFQRTADFWSTYISSLAGVDVYLKPHDVAVMMSLLKISRITWSPTKRDHWVDLSGYAACGYDCAEREKDHK
jgi:Domain of unknown function (DUF6378)